MRVPRRSAALLGVAALTIVLVATVVARGRDATLKPTAVSWLGLVGEPRAPTLAGQRSIVLLTTPSVAQRLATVRYATESQERSWTSQAFAAQQQVLTKLASLGVTVQPDFSYARVVDGFAAALDSRAIALLGQMPEVAGVYPVRAAFPASISASLLASKEFGPLSGHRVDAGLPGFDGRGVTIALLDTGVDASHPYLRGRVLPGFDMVDHGADATAHSDPQDPSQIERHGTELAGILAGSGGPGGLHGVAPGATILPIRVAGWQPAADGHDLVFARTDQVIAGLERAVDPNGDGDTHDAVRVALLGVAEPYAAFTDGPEAQAVQGALDLNTLVVAPAGNDGAAGPSFGSIAGPAGAPGALAVGATDSRTELSQVRVVLRRGLDVILDQKLPLLGAAAPSHSLSLRVATPRSTRGLAGSQSVDYFNAKGYSLVAGRAVVVPVGADPQATAVDASRAGAAAVVLYGAALPPGSLRVAEDETAPVVVVPTAAAVELLAAQRAGIDVGIAIGAGRDAANLDRGGVAAFSSQGLAFDGGIKPNVVAPGIALATAEPGAATDGSPLYGTVNGTSGAAATVAGAAALLAQMRPSLDGPSLDSLLVGYAQPGGASATAVGAGTFRLGASAVGEVAAQPTTLGFGIWQGARWHATRTIVVRNVSTRRLQLSLSVVIGNDPEALNFTVSPNHLVLRVGRAASVQVTVRAPAAPVAGIITGFVQVAPSGSEALHVPWALDFERTPETLLGRVAIDRSSFAASDTNPAILSVQAGNVVHEHGVQIQAVSRLDILLYSASGRYLGVMARLRDLLPGSYSFGITGRGPSSARLPAGSYELRLAAWPTLPLNAKPSRAQVSFRME
ncbi:MAG TPA: S8 family serine peptidase [Gaiellaceae bacterium]|nr:S8 family serine peptidase [Gaiellaceae bacterium]